MLKCGDRKLLDEQGDIMFLTRKIMGTVALGLISCLSVGTASATTLFSDNFDGAGNVAGNAVPGWTQYEVNSGGVSLINYGAPHNLVMALTGQQSGSPDAAGAAGLISTVGYNNLQISFDWLRRGTESDDSFYFSYIVAPVGGLTSALMQNEGAWTTTLISNGGSDTNWATISPLISLSPSGDNSSIAIMFWTVSNGSCSFGFIGDCDTDYFKVDNVVLSGDQIQHFPGDTPLPAALPLFASGLGALGVLGWRRKRKAAA
jgi:hypothetical protein